MYVLMKVMMMHGVSVWWLLARASVWCSVTQLFAGARIFGHGECWYCYSVSSVLGGGRALARLRMAQCAYRYGWMMCIASPIPISRSCPAR